jgi:hypothetical protein
MRGSSPWRHGIDPATDACGNVGFVPLPTLVLTGTPCSGTSTAAAALVDLDGVRGHS